jgi:hypothetical protein
MRALQLDDAALWRLIDALHDAGIDLIDIRREVDPAEWRCGRTRSTGSCTALHHVDLVRLRKAFWHRIADERVLKAGRL